MERIEKSIEVRCPVRTAYNQWTQFEEFPRFMSGVEEVRQIDDTHLHWVADIAGVERQWDAEIIQQIPDQMIAWQSTSGPVHSGTVIFTALDTDRCQVTLAMEYDPSTFAEKGGRTEENGPHP